VEKFEYKVIPAPTKASKVKGLKRGEDKFAASLAAILNEQGAEGWQYQRTDTLPVESRAGLTSHSTAFHNMLIFRRVINEVGREAHVEITPETPPVSAADAMPEPIIKAPVEPIMEPAMPEKRTAETSGTKAPKPAEDQSEISNANA